MPWERARRQFESSLDKGQRVGSPREPFARDARRYLSAEHSPVRSLVISADSAGAFELAMSLRVRTAKKECVDRYNLTLQPKCDS